MSEDTLTTYVERIEAREPQTSKSGETKIRSVVIHRCGHCVGTVSPYDKFCRHCGWQFTLLLNQ